MSCKRFILLPLFFFLAVLPLGAQQSLSWSLDDITVEGLGDSLRVTLDYRFRNWNVAANRAVVFSPVIQNGDEKVPLTPVSVYGRKAALETDEHLASGTSDEYSVLDLSSPMKVSVEDVIPYAGWMDTLKVILSVGDWSRKDGLRVRSNSQKGVYVKPPMPLDFRFPWDVEEPAEERRPFRELSFSTPVRFEDGQTRFDPFYESNGETMASFVERLRFLSSTKTFSVRSSSLLLTVPPTGNSREAVKLSKQRLQTVYNYLSHEEGLFRQWAPSRVGGGEDWKGVLEWVRGGRLVGDERLMEILSGDYSGDERADALRSEKSVLWEILEEDCFPLQGTLTYDVSFRTPLLSSPKEVLPFYEKLPEALSARDFWTLAGDYVQGSPEWTDVMRRGAELHPESVELSLNAVFGLVACGMPNAAAPFLRTCGDDIRAKYAYAVWFYAMGRYQECLELIEALQDESTKFGNIYESAVPFIKWGLNRVRWEKYIP